MAISRFSSDDYPKLGVYQIVANQSRKLGIWRSLNEGGRTAPCFLRFPQREKYQLCPDGKQNRNYRWHRSPALDAIRGPRAPHGASCCPGLEYLPTRPGGWDVGERERIKAPQ